MVFPLASFAQNQGQGQRMSPEERAKADAQRMKEQLVLTDSQTVKYEKISLKYGQMRREIFQAANGDTAVMRTKSNELNQKIEADVKPIFTADQFTKFQKINAERRGRMGRGGPRPDGGGPRPPRE